MNVPISVELQTPQAQGRTMMPMMPMMPMMVVTVYHEAFTVGMKGLVWGN